MGLVPRWPDDDQRPRRQPSQLARAQAYAASLTDGELAGELRKIGGQDGKMSRRPPVQRRAMMLEAANRLTRPPEPQGARTL